MLDNNLSSTFDISALIVLERKAELSAEERTHLDVWLNKSEANRALYLKLQNKKTLTDDFSILKSFETERAWQAVNVQINKDVKIVKFSRFKFTYYSAAAVILILFGLFLFNRLSHNDVAGFKNQPIVQNLETINTPIGKVQDIILPDGTKVRLSAASSLSYSRTFDDPFHRTVILNGEAFFDVIGDRSRHFIVKTKLQEIEVIGTRFLVESYDNDDNVKTSLYSGKVKIKRQNAEDVVLSPGQQSLVTSFAVRINNLGDSAETYDPAMSDYITFNKETIEQVMRKVSRWYDIKVKYDGPIGTAKISGSISTEMTLPKVVNILSMLFPDDSIKLKDSVIIIKQRKK